MQKTTYYKQRLLTFYGACLAFLTVFAVSPRVWAEDAAVEATTKQGALPGYEQFIDDILMLDILNMPLWRILAAIAIIVLGVLIRTSLLDKLLTPIKLLTSHTETEIDDIFLESLRKPLGWIINLFAIYFAILILELPQGLQDASVLILKTVGTGFVAWMLFRVIDAVSLVLERFAQRTESEIDDQLVPLLKRILRVVLFIITAIMIIQQWGYDVTSLIAGLGIGGLAFALAAQSTLTNWFGSLMILTDRPFKVGDWVKWSSGEGIVEEVGLRSTKVRTFTKTLITIPNGDIATQAVENMSQMPIRRFTADIGLVYSTSGEQVEKIVGDIRELIAQNEHIDQEFWAVNFVGFGASSLDISILAFTKTTAWAEWRDVQQDIFLNIMKIVENNGSSFAFPSQSIYFENSLEMRSSDAMRPSQKGAKAALNY